jgi:hypothetical protein
MKAVSGLPFRRRVMKPVKNSLNCRRWFIFLTFFSLILVSCFQSPEELSKALLPTAVPPPSTANSAPPARVYHMMVYDSTRQVTILFGGIPAIDETEDSGEDEGVSHYFSDTWEYNGETWRQIDVAGLRRRGATGMAWLMMIAGVWRFYTGESPRQPDATPIPGNTTALPGC